MTTLEREANIFGRYLIRQSINDKSIALYIDAHQHLPLQAEGESNRILNRALKSPALIKYLDAGLALSAPESILRRKLFVLLSILESQPQFADLFLPAKGNFKTLFKVFLNGCAGAFTGITGYLIISLFYRNDK